MERRKLQEQVILIKKMRRLIRKKSSELHAVATLMGGSGCDEKCSMVVPVCVSHIKSPNREELVYALLDSQSDTSFILDKTRQSLGVDGPEITLRLSRMLAKKTRNKKCEGV